MDVETTNVSVLGMSNVVVVVVLVDVTEVEALDMTNVSVVDAIDVIAIVMISNATYISNTKSKTYTAHACSML